MIYSVPNIINWSKICQPLARIGEAQKQARNDSSADTELDVKIYMTRKDVEYEYAQDPTSDNLYSIANYLLALCGVYLFKAQEVTGNGGSITPIVPGGSSTPVPYDFIVSGSSFIIAGQSLKTITSFIGYNIQFFRGNVIQTTVSTEPSYYTWDSATGTFQCFPEAQSGELFQLYAI